MRLTLRLLRGHRHLKDLAQRKWNDQWNHYARIYELPLKVPQALLDQGVEISDSKALLNKEYNTITEFVPPVANDPRWIKEVPLEERADWKDLEAGGFTFDEQLFEGVTQACMIAKAQHFDHLPNAVDRLVGQVETVDRDQLLQQAIMLSQVWNTDTTKLPPRKAPPSHPAWWNFGGHNVGITYIKSSQIMLQNLLRLCKNRLSDFPSLAQRRHVFDPLLHSYVMYKDQPIVQKDILDCIITSPSPLPPFAGQESIDQSVQYKVPDMWPVLPTVDFIGTNNYDLKDITGYKPTPGIHPHTLIQIPRSYNWAQRTFEWTDDQFLGSAIMSCLTYTAALARQKYGQDVRTLPEPISVQHVCMLPTQYLITCFQLNTLDLDTDVGIKNMVWTSKRCQLFEKVNAAPWIREVENEHLKYERLIAFDGEAFEPLLAAYLNGCDDVGPLLQQLERAQ